MCQINSVKINLKKDKIAYKVGRLKRMFTTPYMGSKLPVNKLITAKGIPYAGRGWIYGGFFHCYTNKKEAKKFAVLSDKEVVVKVIIPSGTLAYKGIFKNIFSWTNSPLPSYCTNTICAKQIIIKEKI